MCGVSRQTVYRLIEDGRLPASRREGQVQVRRVDVVTLIESSRIIPGSLARTPAEDLPPQSFGIRTSKATGGPLLADLSDLSDTCQGSGFTGYLTLTKYRLP